MLFAQPTNAGSGVQGFDPKTIGGTVQGLRNAGARKGPTAVVSGKNCTVYTLTLQNGSQELCIGEDNLPYQIITNSGGVRTTLVFSDYNTNLDIKPPI